jgi:PAS domain S-box-containing protein
MGRVLATHRPEILRLAAAQAGALEIGARTAGGVRMLACLPVGRAEGIGGEHDVDSGSTQGVLVLLRFRDDDLDPDHLALLESLAASVATAIDNARLNQRLGEAIRFRDHVLESMLDGVIALDRGGRVLVMNEVAEALLGIARDEALGRILPPGLLVDGDAPGDPFQVTRNHPVLTRRSEGWVAPAGRERRPVRLASTQLRDERGRVYGTLVTFFDLTAMREMERRIRHLDRIAALGRFTSAVAHELKNPLAGIAAGLEYLSRSIAAEDARRTHLDFVSREVARLDRIVSDLSRAGRPRDPEPQAVRIETALADAVRVVHERPEGAGAVIHLDLASDLPAARVDPDHLAQALLNLLLNGVQAAATGGQPVRVRAWADSPAGGTGKRLWIAVEDSGPGIPADNLERIFEPFFTTRKEGTGLGLYLCHEMVKRNGGEITVRNRTGGGAQFLIELPASPA